jgi:hypothetical protein
LPHYIRNLAALACCLWVTYPYLKEICAGGSKHPCCFPTFLTKSTFSHSLPVWHESRRRSAHSQSISLFATVVVTSGGLAAGAHRARSRRACARGMPPARCVVRFPASSSRSRAVVVLVPSARWLHNNYYYIPIIKLGASQT